MAKYFPGLILFFLLASVSSKCQQITYSEIRSEDNRDINFEILGKMNDHYVVYKNVRWKHMLAFYDNEMRIAKSMRLAFVPDKTFNIDFIVYPDHFYVIYQYQKNSIIYCKAAKLDNFGEKLTEPVTLDTTKVGILADNKIYNTTFSQDKQRILIYKIQVKNQIITLATKLFDKDMNMLDSTRYANSFDERREIYSDLSVDNNGGIIVTKETKKNFRDNVSQLEVLTRKPGDAQPTSTTIPLQEKYIDEIKIKIDNLNRQYIINSFYYTEDRLNVRGLFTAVVKADDPAEFKSAFNEFPDSLRAMVNYDGQFKYAFDNFFLRQSIVKKDGGFILAAEDYSLQTRGGRDNWNRWNYINSPYISNYNYYLTNPYWYYRPFNSFNNMQTVRYYYDDILILSIDSSLKMQWSNVISKKQTDDETDNFMSFSTMNSGSEIHFIYIERDRNKQVLSNHSILPSGQVKRYPTLKSREIGYEFMPRLAKQIGLREVIIPCTYRSSIAFAKVVFAE